jgi:hypothetical protein
MQRKNGAIESPCDGVSMRSSVSAMESPCDGPVAMDCLDTFKNLKIWQTTEFLELS